MKVHRLLLSLLMLASMFGLISGSVSAKLGPGVSHREPAPAPDLARGVELQTLTTTDLTPIADTYVASTAPDANFGDRPYMVVGVEGDDVYISLVQFDLSALPAQAVIAEATFQAQVEESAGSGHIDLASLNGKWHEADVTYATIPPVGAAAATVQDVAADGWVEWEITELVQAWVSGTRENFGFALTPHKGDAYLRLFATKENDNQKHYPTLRVAYTLPAPPPAGSVHISEIPLYVHRRAAQHLEEVRGTDMAPGWENAGLFAWVRPLYRPDAPDLPSYWEFAIEPGMDFSWPDGIFRGFILATAGEHDFPIAHWGFAGQPPTYALEAMESRTGYPPERFYKLDTLSYAAQDWTGALIALLGDLPPKIEGMELDWLDEDLEITETGWVFDVPPGEDIELGTLTRAAGAFDEASGADAGMTTGTPVITGPVGPPPGLEISGWSSWSEFKDGYADSYAVFLEQLRRDAAGLWETEQTDLEYGIVLRKADIYPMALLWEVADLQLEGPGVSYITTQTIPQEDSLSDLFEITVAADVPLGFTPFTVTVSYDDDVEETVRFQIVELARVYLPMLIRNQTDSNGGSAVARLGEDSLAAQVAATSSWSGWRTFWAGAEADQRYYRQLAIGEHPNDSNCASGCGATAWAMLFGWVSHQACPPDPNPDWSHREGIYREDGSVSGSFACAPQSMDGGVRNITWEIRGTVGTYCAPWPWRGNAATHPWNMKDANDYLIGRTWARIRTVHSRVGRSRDEIRVNAARSITLWKTPVVVGTGWFNHYPLAFGYRFRSRESCGWFLCSTEYQREFHVNQGWGSSSHNSWVSAETWFSGRLYP